MPQEAFSQGVRCGNTLQNMDTTPDQDRYPYPLRFVREGDKYVLQNPHQPDINPDYYTPEAWEASVLCPHCGGKVVVKTPIKP